MLAELEKGPSRATGQEQEAREVLAKPDKPLAWRAQDGRTDRGRGGQGAMR
jgi:hypothetical protein